jgi:histidine triad (HIT) family protein
MDDCIFCKIIAGDIPSYKIYENDAVYAFLDVAEDGDGHTLVVPKQHCRNMFDAPPETVSAVLNAVQTIARHYVRNCGYDGINVLNFNEECAGQTVFHLHFHIYPRKNGDDLFHFPKFKKCTMTLADAQQKLRLQTPDAVSD